MLRHPLAFVPYVLLLAVSGCLLDTAGEQASEGEFDDPDLETTGNPIAIYGREINLRPCDWPDRPSATVCRRGTTYDSAACKYDWKGEPYTPDRTATRTVTIDGRTVSVPVENTLSILTSRQYNLLPAEAGRALKWGPSRFYNGANTTPAYPLIACNPALDSAYVSLLGQHVGEPLLRVPAIYDHPNPGLVRATLRYSQVFTTQAEVDARQQPGNLILALQKKLPDGSWQDLATKDAQAPSRRDSSSEPLLLEVSAKAELNDKLRLEARIGHEYGKSPEAYRVHEVRLFAPTCVPDERSGECLD